MSLLLYAFASCLSLAILGIVAVILSWKNRDKIESIALSKKGIVIQFVKKRR